MSEFFSLFDQAETALQQAGLALRAGKLVVFPTDTIYGIGADAFNREATAEIFRLKGRTRALPLPVLVSRPRQAWALCDLVPGDAVELAAAFWPGALTLVLSQAPGLEWDLGDARSTIAIRMPAHDDLIALLEMVGPIAATSANISGEPTPRALAEVASKLGESVAVYLDGGESKAETGSTIVDLSREQPLLVREGPIPASEIERVVGRTVARAG